MSLVAEPVEPTREMTGGTRHRKLPLRPLLAVIVVILVGLVAAVAVQLTRPLPAAAMSLSLPTTTTIPGPAPVMPWPAQGQARIDVQEIGTLGDSGGAKQVPIGSVAKVMTAYIVLTDHPLAAGADGPSITVTAADVADYQARIASHQSLVQVTAGERLTERQALAALMLPSANNVAQILAQWDAGSADAFVAKMNSVAAKLGLHDTRYTDPSGFAPTTVSSADDQTVLAEEALKSPTFTEIVGLSSATVPVAGTVKNFNTLLGTDGVFGIKTGSTDQAGGNLVFAAHLTVAGKPLTMVGAVLSQPGRGTPEQLVATNAATRKLLEAAARVVAMYPVVQATTVGRVHAPWGGTAPVRTAGEVQVLGWPGLPVTVDVRRAEPGSHVTTGQTLGTVTAKTRTGQGETTLVSGGAVGEPSWQWRLMHG